ncbi:hypothetical protein OEZ85_012842 [Tetradesmus obliquus]|uniref:Expansin-like EG45 domain-containing protein n=1 Tax=Tetradesmus obliquus TaxID=3088 RepID=A0ABY8U3T9_TETOB|nr:hypothetical protein OEZ85_012842 [Tetradesmus obliquus]
MALAYVLVALSLLSLAAANSPGFGGWQTGRATHYGTDAWSIHKGSCGYGWLDKNVATGWDVGAISDKAGDFAGSCGKCKEVKCKPMGFADGYGQWLDRNNVCYNDYSSVVIMVTDTCPCVYPDNYASNKRWCCGDMYHIDLSVWAYEKLAGKQWGVIGVAWRDVPCWYRPKNKARVPWWTKPTPKPWWEKAPSGWSKNMDKRLSGPKYQNGWGWGKK